MWVSDFSSGSCSAFFGLGGSFFVTPALLVLGHPAEAAVGSGLVFVFGTAITAAITHRSAGHIDYRLGAVLVIGMSVGIETGKRVLFWLVARGLGDIVVSVCYVLLLAVVGVLLLRQIHADEMPTVDDRHVQPLVERSVFNQLPPRLRLKSGGIVSLWLLIGIGVAIGTLSGFLGVGGGFLMVPSLVYGVGLSNSVAVGTDIFQIAGSSAFGSARYLQQDAVHFSVVLPLLGGSVSGAYIGARMTEILDESSLMGYFALMLLLDSVAMASKTISHAYDIGVLHDFSIALLFGTALLVGSLILFRGGKTLLETPST
ncbi:sulfite exporter TauE/SafE family protein [Halomarina oriensis]|uniref:sulfite exporter TauE/SafE family protein n=1 Tax=Halomarina oriensis TaxID=671145 RepID=UPI001E2EC85B|nr:sulfite exporter TauE/SafE family protein [Halomarina oriensis]